jgi:ABC-type ATPase with predicted acetyltransferase domain
VYWSKVEWIAVYCVVLYCGTVLCNQTHTCLSSRRIRILEINLFIPLSVFLFVSLLFVSLLTKLINSP